MYFIYLLCWVLVVVPDHGPSPGLSLWECEVLATGSPGKSLTTCFNPSGVHPCMGVKTESFPLPFTEQVHFPSLIHPAVILAPAVSEFFSKFPLSSAGNRASQSEDRLFQNCSRAIRMLALGPPQYYWIRTSGRGPRSAHFTPPTSDSHSALKCYEIMP